MDDKFEKIDKIDQYEVSNVISSGSSGVVYLVTKDQKRFALKLLKKTEGDGASALVRFRRESASLARIDHENLVKIFSLGEYNGSPYLVMEYLEGNSLESKLKKEGAQSFELALQTIKSLAKGLFELHKHNLVHRDIKPANILFTNDGVPKIIDLGLVYDITLEKETALVGTPMYCSPEQSRVLKRDVDFRSDLYSLGVVLFELLTGKPPINGTLSEILQKHASFVPPDVREINPKISAAAALITKKLLSKDPDDRYQTASGLIRDIDRSSEIDQLVAKQADPKLGASDNIIVNHSSIYVDKSEETKLLKKSWVNVSQGDPKIVIVAGPSGSGKTRLCTEFINSEVVNKESGRYLILRGKCQIFDKDMPFAALKESVDGWIEELFLSQSDTNDKSIAKIKTAGQGYESKLLQFSKVFQRIFTINSKSQSSELNAEGEREVFLKDISSFFVKLAHEWKGIVLFVDDLQWLDESSLQLIETIFNDGGKNSIFLLSTARDDQESQQQLDKIKARLVNQIDAVIKVQPFSKEQLEKLIRDFLGQQKIDDQIIEQLRLRADGSPFVAIEYLRAVIDQGLIHFKGGQWAIAREGFESLTLSENIYSLIVKRSDKLSTSAKTVLQYAALWGGQFIASDIVTVAKVQKGELNNIMSSCEATGLIERQGSNKWRFVHDKIQESLVSSIAQDNIPKMCDELADFYEEKKEISPDEIYSLARIRSKGDVKSHFQKAIQANITAGNLAIENFAYSEAKVMFSLAYEFNKLYDSDRSFEKVIAPKLATCATVTGDWPLAAQCADLNIKLSNSKEERQFALMLKVWTLKNRGSYTSGFKYFEEACNENGEPYPIYFQLKMLKTLGLWFWTTFLDILLPFLPQPSEKLSRLETWLARRADLYVDAHWCAEFNGWVSDYVYLSFKILSIGLSTRRPKELAYGYSWVGHVYASWGLGLLAKIYFSKAKAITEGMDDKFTIAMCKQKELDGLYNAGMLPNYEEAHKKYLSEYEKYLPPTQSGFANVWRIYELSFRGLHEEALATFVEAMAGIKTGKTVLGDNWINTWLVLNWLQLESLGRHSEAQKAKLIAMRTNYKNRFNPNISRLTLFTELTARRILESLETDLEELIAALVGGDNLIIYTQISCSVAVQVFYNILNLLETCTNPGKRLSLRAEFNRLVRKINSRTHTPLTKSNINLLRGRYYRICGLPTLAMHYYRKAEKLASLANGQRTLFEVERETARIYQGQGHPNLMTTRIKSAVEFALDHSWAPTLKKVQSEFGNLISDRAFGGEGELATSTQHYRSNNKSLETQIKSTHYNPTATTQSQKTSIDSGIGDVRFIDVLLEVTQTFVESIDPEVQSKSVLTQIVKLFAAERGVIFIKDDKTGDLKIMAGKNSSGEELTKLTGFSGTVVKKVFDTGEPLIVTGTEQGESLGSESAVLHNLRSIMATPLKVKEEIIGVVYLDSSLTKGLFTDTDIGLFSTLSNHVSVAFELSRMAKVELEKANLKRELDIQSAIAVESKKVEVLVDNMQQALFSIDGSGTIIEPVSKFSTQVFGFDVAGKNVMETLYSPDTTGTENRTMIKSALGTVFGEDDLQWSLMESNLPKKVSYSVTSKDRAKTLKVGTAPIWGSEEKLESILFVVEDVTELEVLEKEMTQKRHEATLLEETLSKDPADLGEFLDLALKDLSKTRLEQFGLETQNERLRDLHTLKGNARLFGLKYLSSQIHDSESELIALKDAKQDSSVIAESFPKEFEKIENTINEYIQIFTKVFRQNPNNVQSKEFNSLSISKLTESVSKIIPRLNKKDADVMHLALDRLSYKSTREMVLKFETMVSEISDQLNKKVTLSVTGDALLDSDRLRSLQECLLHIIRNSVDHGIETSQERAQTKKGESGKITVNFEELENEIVISVSDDGKGMDREKIWSKAVKMGLVKFPASKSPSDNEKLEVIFAPGFSSKDVATDISGRGIGLDVVRENVEKMGGQIKIETEIGRFTKFKIILPVMPVSKTSTISVVR